MAFALAEGIYEVEDAGFGDVGTKEGNVFDFYHLLAFVEDEFFDFIFEQG